MKSIIILGNGPSLKTVDIKHLTLDTFGLNRAYKEFQRIQWFPTYFGAFDITGSRAWDYTGIQTYLNESHLHTQSYYFLKSSEDKLISTAKTVFLNNHEPNHFRDTPEYTFPVQVHLDMAFKQLKKVLPDITIEVFYNIINSSKHRNVIASLNEKGIVNLVLEVLELPHEFSEDLFIGKPRKEIYHYLPESFEDFGYIGTNSSVMAVLIAILLKYEKIILLGVDCEWHVTPDREIKELDSYWFNDYFESKYKLKEFCAGCSEQSLTRMHLNAWGLLQQALEFNKIGVDIVNCSIGSKMDIFRQSTLDKEI